MVKIRNILIKIRISTVTILDCFLSLDTRNYTRMRYFRKKRENVLFVIEIKV